MTNSPLSTNDKTILSVGQLNRKAKQLLETHLSLVWVSGELSNLVQHGSGHWYFSLKDDQAQIKCAMFKQRNRYVQWQPRNGQQLLIRARVSLYEARGDYQLIVEHMEQSGHGALQQAYEALKLKLQQEGLFDSQRKQALPKFPRHIGVITSPSGAAIRDILSVLERRFPVAAVTVLPVAVQGEGAAESITDALQKAQRYGLQPRDNSPFEQPFDVLILARGGGSIEDLWAFNNEALARTIAQCSIPTVSAVGHEVDFTIADFVADVRAPTPSASAELTTPDATEWLQTFDSYEDYFTLSLENLIANQRDRLYHLFKRLRHPGERIQNQQQQLKVQQQRISQALTQRLERLSQQTSQLQQRINLQHPQYRLTPLSQQLQQLSPRLVTAMQQMMSHKQSELARCGSLLDAVSPLHTLKRGYSLVTDTGNNLVRSSEQLQPGQSIKAQFGLGSAECQIVALNHDSDDT